MNDKELASAQAYRFRSENTPYWLCCGSIDRNHADERALSCYERKAGNPERCVFGTAQEHFAQGRK